MAHATQSERNLSAGTDPSTTSELPPGRFMTRLSTVLNTATNLFPVWVLLGALVAFLRPSTLLWFRASFIVPTLAVIMLGMGLTISPSSFTAVSRAPRLVVLGAFTQYTIMPLMAWLLSRLLCLPAPLAAGVILVGVCPGGAASNVVCLLARANVPLSVVLTLTSTLLSIVLIPTLMHFLAGTLIPVNAMGLLLSTAQVVLAPLALGAILNRLMPQAISAVAMVLPLISVIGVTLICSAVVAANAAALSQVGFTLVVAVACLHALGGLVGYIIARLACAPVDATRTIAVEVMMQNSSLAVSLAHAHFVNPLTAVPGALSATMHSVFGSLLAGFWRISDARQRSRK